MREIKFKGKTFNGKWIIGDLNQLQTSTFIHWNYRGTRIADEVNINTVCQFTGLYDKNGVEIYEGDIIKVIALDNGHSQRGATSNHEVIECMGNFCLDTGTTLYPFKLNHIVEVIGNIHEKE